MTGLFGIVALAVWMSGSMVFWIWRIEDGIDGLTALVHTHINWHIAEVKWEHEKLRTIAISSPHTRLSYRRKVRS